MRAPGRLRGRVFNLRGPLKRVVAFIDGYNVYHSVVELGHEANYLKWINLQSLVKALIHPTKDTLSSVEYFSADAHWNPNDKKKRHTDYILALEHVGVRTHIGAFKKVTKFCTKCEKSYKAFEENGTDVAIAAKMVQFAHENRFDKALLFSADSDLVPIVTSILESHPEKEIYIVTTSSRIRFAKKLRAVATGFIEIDKENFQKNLLDKEIVAEGKTVTRPAVYDPPPTR